jgi:hypothetical protein
MSPALLLTLAVQGQLATWTGYVDSRTTGAWTQFDGAPHLTELVEGNVQVKLVPHEKVKFFADTSIFWQGAWAIQGGGDVPANYRPTFVASELYADLPLQENFRLLIGKKRIVWGPGMSFNPTDVLNPAKDPTDPTSQRAGAWLAEAEWGFEKAALSLVGAAKVTQSYSGLPTALIKDPTDGTLHYAFAARLYLLLADIDINLIYAFTNLYNDSFEHKSKWGGTLSRVLFGGLEMHGEVLFYTGSSRVIVNESCITQIEVCAILGTPIITRPDLGSNFVNAFALGGFRYQFENNAILSAEYYFNGEGQDPQGFKNLARMVVRYPTQAQAALTGSVDPGSPQKFALSAIRRHYLVLQASVPQIADDWTLSGTVIAGLEDLSMQLVPQVQWMPFEWLQLTASAYIPIAGLTESGAKVLGKNYGQFTLSPFQTRLLLQARAYF